MTQPALDPVPSPRTPARSRRPNSARARRVSQARARRRVRERLITRGMPLVLLLFCVAFVFLWFEAAEEIDDGDIDTPSIDFPDWAEPEISTPTLHWEGVEQMRVHLQEWGPEVEPHPPWHDPAPIPATPPQEERPIQSAEPSHRLASPPPSA